MTPIQPGWRLLFWLTTHPGAKSWVALTCGEHKTNVAHQLSAANDWFMEGAFRPEGFDTNFEQRPRR